MALTACGQSQAPSPDSITQGQAESVHRILSLKAEYGLTNGPVCVPDVDGLDRQVEDLLEMLGN